MSSWRAARRPPGSPWPCAGCCRTPPRVARRKADRDKPVNLEADRVTVDDAKQIAVFEGNVVLTQGTLQIRGDRMEVRQDKEGFRHGTTWGNLAYFRQKRDGVDEYIEGWAERIEYDGRAEKMQMFTRAMMKRRGRSAGKLYLLRFADRVLPGHRRRSQGRQREQPRRPGPGHHVNPRGQGPPAPGAPVTSQALRVRFRRPARRDSSPAKSRERRQPDTLCPGPSLPSRTHSELRAEGLKKRYRSQAVVVKDVSLEVRSGEVIGLLGPNGAGKTTCFYMMVGLVPMDGGELFLDGRRLTHMPMHRRARLGLSYLPQEASIFRRLTVAENVQAVLELYQGSRNDPQPARRACCTICTSAICTATSRSAFPAESAGASRLPARWRASRASSCSMSRLPASIRLRCWKSRRSSDF